MHWHRLIMEQLSLAGAVAWRQVRTWPRYFRFYLLRMLYVIALAAGGVVVIVQQDCDASDFGLTIFMALAVVSTMAVMVTGVVIGGSLVRRERRQATLGLLLMSDVSPAAWLAGELAGAVWSAQGIVLSVLPMLMLVLRYGGVGGLQVLLLLVLIEAVLVASALIGITFSLRKPGMPTQLPSLLIAAPFVLCCGGHLILPIGPAIAIAGGEWELTVIYILGLAIVSVLMAWICSRRACRVLADTSREAPKPLAQAPHVRRGRSSRRSERAGAEAVVWKDNRDYQRSELFGVWIAAYGAVVIVWGAVLALVPLVSAIAGETLNQKEYRQGIDVAVSLTYGLSGFCAVFVPLMLLNRCIRVVEFERENGTLDLLRLTALSDWDLLRHKAWSAAKGLVPGLVMPFVGAVFGLLPLGKEWSATPGLILVLTATYVAYAYACLAIGLFAGLTRGGIFLKGPVYVATVAALGGALAGVGAPFPRLLLVAAIPVVYLVLAVCLLRFRVRRL